LLEFVKVVIKIRRKNTPQCIVHSVDEVVAKCHTLVDIAMLW